MAVLGFLLLILAMTQSTDATWCVCRTDFSDTILQKALDYACGAGADCTAISQNGACSQPNNVKFRCSYAVNSYFQKKGQSSQACDFQGAATTSTQDPSISTCTFPATASSTGTSTTSTPTAGTGTTLTPPTGTTLTPPGTATGMTPGTSTATTGTPFPGTSTTPGAPYTGTPVIGGTTSSIGPSGAGLNTDLNAGSHSRAQMGLLFLVYGLLGLALMIS